MAARNSGQILYLGGSTGTQGNPGGSLSTRFQKLAQSRNSGITVVNPSTGVVGIESRPGRSLGLGFGTGSQTHSPRGAQRISTTGRGGNGAGNRSSGSGSGIVPGGIHTAGGLARAMQERGGGVTDAFLISPTAAVAAGGRGGAGPIGRRAARLTGNAAAVPTGAGRNVNRNNNNNNNNNNSIRSSRHKALMLGGRPGRKQGSAAVSSAAPQQRGKGAPTSSSPAATRAAKAAAKAAGGAQAQGAGKGKAAKKGGKAAKAAPTNAGDLDSELNEYMMKHTSTAARVLDNDLDSYMTDEPSESAW